MEEFDLYKTMDILLSFDGKKFPTNEFQRIVDYIKTLPQNPDDLVLLSEYYYSTIIKDYDKCIFFRVIFYLTDNRKEISEMRFSITNQGRFDNTNKVKSNEEALTVLKEIKEIKCGLDYYPDWEMSEDPAVLSKYEYIDYEANIECNKLISKL